MNSITSSMLPGWDHGVVVDARHAAIVVEVFTSKI